MRKLKFDARFTLQENVIHTRVIVKDENDDILFDSIGKTAPMPPEELKKIPSNDMIIVLLNESFKQGFGDIPLVKVVNNLKNG